MEKNELLEKQVEENLSEISTDSYPMSIWEIASLYEDWDLIIKPDFQREFRWKKFQKTRLVESILLDIPLPSFFLYQNRDWKWEVIDWLQRLSTIFEFMSILREDSKKIIRTENKIYDWLETEDIKYLTELSWLTWIEIWKSLQRKFKRYKINLNIIKWRNESSIKTKYELFQRLNTWWTQLSNQEIKNCIMIMENKKFYDFISELSEYPEFLECLWSLSDNDIEEKYHYELILRFFALKNHVNWDKIDSVNEFIDDNMIRFLSNFDYENEKKIFIKTFYLLNKTLGEDIFKRCYFSENKEEKFKFKRKMLIPVFDILTLFVSKNIEFNIDPKKLQNRIIDLWKDADFNEKIWVGPRIKAKLEYALTNYNLLFDINELKE